MTTLNASAPVGKERKYALVERERRFLLRRRPAGDVLRTVRIVDRCLTGSRIRLREMTELDAAGGTTASVARKLTQKVPSPDGGPGLITTMYLSEAEYGMFAALPAATLTKSRLSVPPLGVDLFGGELTGLVIGEVEFDDDASMARFAPPAAAVAEVTRDPRLTGGRLALTTAAELAAVLADYGVTIPASPR
ncbi:MAG: hypothetical protein ACRDTP_04255 [Mycobacteriales bacterium]